MQGLGVYQIRCSCGKSYIGQIGQPITSYLKEHIVDNNHHKVSNSAIIEHLFNIKHLTCFHRDEVLACLPFYSTQIIREALEIENVTTLMKIPCIKVNKGKHKATGKGHVFQAKCWENIS